jgi:predicted Zn finger-like uncharacterized protein
MKTQCPNCKARFNVDDKYAGKPAKCPKCTKPFTIEAFVETPAAPPRPSGPPAAPAKKPEPAPAETPAKNTGPVAPPAKAPQPSAPPVESPPPAAPEKITEPVTPPVKEPQLAAAPVKSPEPIKPPVTIPKPTETPVAKIVAPAKEEKPVSKPVSKTTLSKIVFVCCWMAVRIIAGALALYGLMLAVKNAKGEHSTLISIFAAADVFLAVSVLIEFLLYYKMWAAIKDSQRSISPGKAVGFLFIPVFNMYWALCMVIGFAEDYNSFINRHGINTKKLPMTLFIIYGFVLMLTILFVTTPMVCVFAFVGRIRGAFLGYPHPSWALFAFVSAIGIIHFITYTLVSLKTCNAVNALQERKDS